MDILYGILLVLAGFFVAFLLLSLLLYLLGKKRKRPSGRGTALFSLSRRDVMDYIEFMRLNPESTAMLPAIKERSAGNAPDYLQCGERFFGLMFARNERVHTFALKLDQKTAKEVYSLERAGYLSGDDWYHVDAGRGFASKLAVYKILAASCKYVSEKFAGASNAADAWVEQGAIEREYAANAGEAEKKLAEAERKHDAALEKFKNAVYSDFSVTRKEIADDILKLNHPYINVSERFDQPQLPMSLKLKKSTYAMLYGMDGGVLMVVKLAEDYADLLSKKHPEICRVSFPHGANWYSLPVDGAFGDRKQVLAVLGAAAEFVGAKSKSEKVTVEKEPKRN
ncbi:MAG: hypothetical protein FWD58_10865 [Firmicutes bacterium]|nr:hypothetical protein [Bacillota bacterium]